MTGLETFLVATAANVAAMMIQKAGTKIAAKLEAPNQKQAVEECVRHGMTALLAKATDASEDTTHKLVDCFGDYFRHEAVVRELSKLLRGKTPDIEDLAFLFEEEANWNRDTLPHLNFEQGMQAFVAAFLESAVFDEHLNRVIQAGQLIKQTDIQRETLAEIRELVAFLREEGRQVTGIRAGEIHAANVVNGQLVIHQMVRTDAVAARAETEESHYLKTLVDCCDQLDLATVDELVAAGDFVCLSDVFTTLNLAGITRKPDQPARDAILTPDAGREAPEKDERIPVQAIEAMAALDRVVILGHPGGGKSTLVNYVTVQLALRRRNAGSAPPLPGWPETETPIPGRIILRQLASELTGDEPNGNAGLV